MPEVALTTKRMFCYDPGHTDVKAWIENMEILCGENEIPDADTKRPLYAVDYITASEKIRTKVKETLELAQLENDSVDWGQFKNFMFEFHRFARYLVETRRRLDKNAMGPIESGGRTLPRCSFVCTHLGAFLHSIAMAFHFGMPEDPGPADLDPNYYNPGHSDIRKWIENMGSLCDGRRVPDTKRPLHVTKYIVESKSRDLIRGGLEYCLKRPAGPVVWAQFTDLMLQFDKLAQYSISARGDLFDQYFMHVLYTSGCTLPYCSFVCTHEHTSIEQRSASASMKMPCWPTILVSIPLRSARSVLSTVPRL